MYIIKFLIRYPSKLIFMRRPSLNSCSQSAHTTHTFSTPLVLSSASSFMRPLFHFTLARWRSFHSHYTHCRCYTTAGWWGPLSKKKTEICELGPNSFFLPFLHFSPREQILHVYISVCLPFFSLMFMRRTKNIKRIESPYFLCVSFSPWAGRRASEWRQEMGGRMQKRLKVRWNCSPERRELSFMH